MLGPSRPRSRNVASNPECNGLTKAAKLELDSQFVLRIVVGTHHEQSALRRFRKIVWSVTLAGWTSCCILDTVEFETVLGSD